MFDPDHEADVWSGLNTIGFGFFLMIVYLNGKVTEDYRMVFFALAIIGMCFTITVSVRLLILFAMYMDE